LSKLSLSAPGRSDQEDDIVLLRSRGSIGMSEKVLLRRVQQREKDSETRKAGATEVPPFIYPPRVDKSYEVRVKRGRGSTLRCGGPCARGFTVRLGRP
jgi:hypothetical protein